MTRRTRQLSAMEAFSVVAWFEVTPVRKWPPQLERGVLSRRQQFPARSVLSFVFVFIIFDQHQKHFLLIWEHMYMVGVQPQQHRMYLKSTGEQLCTILFTIYKASQHHTMNLSHLATNSLCCVSSTPSCNSTSGVGTMSGPVLHKGRQQHGCACVCVCVRACAF
jgi:hypothetical protein